jgi:chromosome segregation ATPase
LALAALIEKSLGARIACLEAENQRLAEAARWEAQQRAQLEQRAQEADEEHAVERGVREAMERELVGLRRETREAKEEAERARAEAETLRASHRALKIRAESLQAELARVVAVRGRELALLKDAHALELKEFAERVAHRERQSKYDDSAFLEHLDRFGLEMRALTAAGRLPR